MPRPSIPRGTPHRVQGADSTFGGTLQEPEITTAADSIIVDGAVTPALPTDSRRWTPGSSSTINSGTCGSPSPSPPSYAPHALSASGPASGTVRVHATPSCQSARSTTGPSGGPTGASSPAATGTPATTPGDAGHGAGSGGPSSTMTPPEGRCRPGSSPSGPSGRASEGSEG